MLWYSFYLQNQRSEMDRNVSLINTVLQCVLYCKSECYYSNYCHVYITHINPSKCNIIIIIAPYFANATEVASLHACVYSLIVCTENILLENGFHHVIVLKQCFVLSGRSRDLDELLLKWIKMKF